MFTAKQFESLARMAPGDPDVTAAKAAMILNDEYDPEDVEATAAWVRQCYHKPRTRELKMHALNAVLDLCGVEALTVDGAYVDSYHGDIVATYLNVGDPYIATVVLDSETGEFSITSWADAFDAWLEAHPEEDTDAGH